MSNPVDDVAKIKKEFEEIFKLLNDINDAAGSFADNLSGRGKKKGGLGKRGSNAGGGSSLGLGDISVPAGSVGGLPPPVAAPSPPWARDAAGSTGVTAGSAAVRAGTAGAGTIAGFMPDTNSMVDMQQALFQASYATGGHMGPGDFDRLSKISKSAFGNMQTSVGSAQRSAAIVSQFGFDPYGAAGQKMLGQVGAISMTTGMSNEQVAGTIASQSTNSVMTNRMRMLGFEMFDSQGNPKDIAAVAHHILKTTYGSNPTPKQIQMGIRPGGALDLMIQSYIPDPGMQEIVKDNMRKQALNKGQYTANDAATANRLGVGNNFLNPRVTGMRYQSTESNKADAMRNSAVTGYGYGVDAASSLNEAFTNLAENVQIVSTLLQTAAGVQGGLTGFSSTGPGSAILGGLSALTSGAGIPGKVLQAVMGMFKADGGVIKGPGGPKDDKIPALLSNGEFVVQADAVGKYGVGFFEALNAKKFADGGLTISGHPALKEGDSHLKTFGVAGGRSITVADWAGPLFQQFLQQWEEDPLLGGSGSGKYTLTKGPLDSYEYRAGRMTSDKISDHAGYAVDLRYDVLLADNQRHMSDAEQAEVRKIMGGFSGRLGWGGDYRKAIDEMHVFVAPGVNGPNDVGATSATTSGGTPAASIGSGKPSISPMPPAFIGVNIGSGLSGVSAKAQSILSMITNEPVFASLGVNQTPSNQSVGSGNTTATPGVASGNYGSGTLSGENLVKLLHDTGFSGGELRTAYGVVMGESGGNPQATHKNTSGKWAGSTDWGLMQMNDVTNLTAGGETVDYSPTRILDPKYNAHIGYLTRNDPKYGGWDDWNAHRDTSAEYSKGVGEYDKHPEWHQGFSKGAWRIDQDQIANIHQNEMILPAPAAEAVRTVMREGRAGQTGSASKAGGGVVINLTVARATDDDAARVAHKVKRMIDDDRMLHAIGGGHA